MDTIQERQEMADIMNKALGDNMASRENSLFLDQLLLESVGRSSMMKKPSISEDGKSSTDLELSTYRSNNFLNLTQNMDTLEQQ